MTRYSYHVSQEQHSPSRLLQLVVQAEHAGFDAAFSSDHLQPWSPSQGHSAFTWSWLGAALQATKRLTFGTITVPCGWRYHPLVLAQAVGTLACMYPGRLPWIAIGSGEALNECLTGAPWPNKEERHRRLLQGFRILKALLEGERVAMDTAPTVKDARLWCRPEQRPLIVGAALTADTALWMGGWAEGLLTTANSLVSLAKIIQAFRAGGGAGKPVHLKVDVSWAPTELEALRQAHDNWRFNAVGAEQASSLRQPEDFEQASRGMHPEDMLHHVHVSADLSRHIAYLRACAALGVEAIDIHQVGTNQEAFIEAFGRHVLPALKARETSPA